MKNLERKRKVVKNTNILLIISMIITIILVAMIIYLIFENYDINLKITLYPFIIIMIALALFLTLYKNKFSKEYKIKYINKALKNEYKDFSYNPNGQLEKSVLELLCWEPRGSHFSSECRKVHIKDFIKGIYKDALFKQNSLCVKEIVTKNALIGKGEHIETKVLFDGIITEFELQKEYSNILLKTKDLPILEFKNKIKLESNDFNKLFNVSSDSEHDTFLYLTPSMMERIKYLYDEVISSTFFFLISGNKLYIGQNYASNLFEPNIKEKLDEKNIVDDIKSTMNYVKQVIEKLEL